MKMRLNTGLPTATFLIFQPKSHATHHAKHADDTENPKWIAIIWLTRATWRQHSVGQGAFRLNRRSRLNRLNRSRPRAAPITVILNHGVELV